MQVELVFFKSSGVGSILNNMILWYEKYVVWRQKKTSEFTVYEVSDIMLIMWLYYLGMISWLLTLEELGILFFFQISFYFWNIVLPYTNV